MPSDNALVLGFFLLLLSVPAMISAWSDGRVPRVSLFVGLCGVGAVGYAVWMADPAYTVADIPEAVLRVVAQWIP